MRTSDATDKIDVAMAAAQVDLINPEKSKKGVTRKDSSGNEVSQMYADLADGLDAIRKVLGKHKIAIYQSTTVEGQIIMLTTRLAHAGQWIESMYPVCSAAGPQQQVGAALTYARRYSLFALVGIAGADEDKDGKGAADMKAPVDKAEEAKKEKQLNKSETSMDLMLEALGSIETPADLAKWEKESRDPLAELMKTDRAKVVKAYKDRKKTLTPRKEAAE